METTLFDLNGVCLRVMARAELLRPLLVYLDPLGGRDVLCEPEFAVRINAWTGDPELPAGATRLFEGTLPEGVHGRMHELGEERWLTVPGRLALRLRPEAADIRVAEGSEGLVGGSAGILAIEAALARSGQTLAHAAALTLPGQERALLLFAPSGAGKTTTALALALGGFGLLTDDAAVLGGMARSPTVWGLPRPLKVHRHSAAMLPAIAPLLGEDWDRNDEQALARETLAWIAPLPPPRPVALGAMVLLGERTGSARHRLTALPRAELLLRLARDNVSNGPRGLPHGQLRRFQALAGVVAALPAYELRVGSELASLPGIVREMLS